jgi:hypothetical protein
MCTAGSLAATARQRHSGNATPSARIAERLLRRPKAHCDALIHAQAPSEHRLQPANVEKRPGAAGVGAGFAHSEPSRLLVNARERSQLASLWLRQRAAISTCACLHRAALLRTRSHDGHLHSDVQQCFSAQHRASSSILSMPCSGFSPILSYSHRNAVTSFIFTSAPTTPTDKRPPPECLYSQHASTKPAITLYTNFRTCAACTFPYWSPAPFHGSSLHAGPPTTARRPTPDARLSIATWC